MVIQFSPEALKIVTDKQRESLIGITSRFNAYQAKVTVAFDLPAGSVEFVLLDFNGNQIINGGVDPEGVVST